MPLRYLHQGQALIGVTKNDSYETYRYKKHHFESTESSLFVLSGTKNKVESTETGIFVLSTRDSGVVGNY